MRWWLEPAGYPVRDIEQALELAQKAVAIDPSSNNYALLAMVEKPIAGP